MFSNRKGSFKTGKWCSKTGNLVILSQDGPGQRALSRDICSCPCPGTKGQDFFLPRDVPSLGNPSSSFPFSSLGTWIITNLIIWIVLLGSYIHYSCFLAWVCILSESGPTPICPMKKFQTQNGRSALSACIHSKLGTFILKQDEMRFSSNIFKHISAFG